MQFDIGLYYRMINSVLMYFGAFCEFAASVAVSWKSVVLWGHLNDVKTATHQHSYIEHQHYTPRLRSPSLHSCSAWSKLYWENV